MDLLDKVIVITGAARGLGAAIARQIAAKGGKLALVDLEEKDLKATQSKCEELGVTARIYTADVADEQQVITLYERVVDEFGRLDVSINNAGILRDGLLVKTKESEITDKLSLEHWQAVIDVNLTGVFLCGREAAAQMILGGRGGCIINMASISRAGNFGQSNYAAAKAGVCALTVVWAKERARHDIRVNAIAPGTIKTEMTASMRPEMLEKIAAGGPLQRLGEPDEIAHTAIYILENDYVDGRVIEIDGGLRL
ncbi:uncharacterized protein METZ01_LOCUS124892 [marine metagenome]|uniref:Ketoreductase domain-containing protein n=1 Tax=marine metagenome TaxID=408172 RepID=A0A381Y4U1_9ZZZZ